MPLCKQVTTITTSRHDALLKQWRKEQQTCMKSVVFMHAVSTFIAAWSSFYCQPPFPTILSTTRTVLRCTWDMTTYIRWTTIHHREQGHNYHRFDRCRGRLLRISFRYGCRCRNSRYLPSHLRSWVSRRRLHCTQTLPVDICRSARHRS